LAETHIRGRAVARSHTYYSVADVRTRAGRFRYLTCS